ncbi:universal stress protein [bacterium]|nr:universal stress protein [bacterium]
MLAFKQILCPIDFSQPSFRALTDALELIRRFGGKLTVLHVVPPVPLVELPPGTGTVAFDVKKYESELITTYDQTLRDTVKERIGSDVPVEYHVALGDAAAQIVSYAEAKKMDCIVIATHGRTGWRRFVHGSVTEAVIRKAHCAVLTIPCHDSPE